MLAEMQGVYLTVEWLSASQEPALWSYLRPTDKGYIAAIYHRVSFFLFGANPTGCNIVLFKRGKWLISILFSSFRRTARSYPQYIGSAWILFSCFDKPALRKNMPQCWSPLTAILIAFVIILLSGRKWIHYSSFLGPPVFTWHVT